ncbi:ATP-binding cassette domain-containing protein [Chloroflexus sp.]|uniref:ATP-binding cassette domain-containing protein n=1 Tax=Chloroflexus sp. TaxID=1904827 RepID=UPI00261BCAE2|nr:ATP-binding cassette domain-containing protein [uncultured Chloroflexus sp.]
MTLENWLLRVERLHKHFGPTCPDCHRLTGPDNGRSRCPRCGTVWACVDVNIQLEAGEVLGIVGESGSGKSTLLQMIYLALRPDSGHIWYRDEGEPARDLVSLNRYEARVFRNSRIGIVYQRPELGLNMRFSIGGNVAEKLLLAEWRHFGRIRARTTELMVKTELPPERIDDEPATFSGGMLQRVQIAKALASRPGLLLLDEITSGLDVSVQARVLDLLRRIQWEDRITMLLVSHDLGVVRQLARRTIVMKNGHIVEAGLTDQILEDPQHPYTQLLVSSAL